MLIPSRSRQVWHDRSACQGPPSGKPYKYLVTVHVATYLVSIVTGKSLTGLGGNAERRGGTIVRTPRGRADRYSESPSARKRRIRSLLPPRLEYWRSNTSVSRGQHVAPDLPLTLEDHQRAKGEAPLPILMVASRVLPSEASPKTASGVRGSRPGSRRGRFPSDRGRRPASRGSAGSRRPNRQRRRAGLLGRRTRPARATSRRRRRS